jgi:CheY-like chemotaxis protein
VKFTYTGEILLEVKTFSQQLNSAKENSIMFCVSDTGIGIKEEQASQLFKMFGKVDDENASIINPHGCGLGLMISRTIVSFLGSKEGINFESEHGKGSKFWFTIDVDLRGDLSDKRDLLSKQNSADSLQGLEISEHSLRGSRNMKLLRREFTHHENILSNRGEVPTPNNGLGEVSTVEKNELSALIVDDNEFNIESLRRILGRLFDLTCDSAYNGLQAIDKVKLQSTKGRMYRVIFMDYDMPVMGGLEASEILVKMMRDGEILEVPIIGCTALAFQSEIEKGISAGMKGYLTKPVQVSELKKIFERLVDHPHC